VTRFKFGYVPFVIAVLTGLGSWLGWLVIHPDVSADPTGDAIYVHAGGRGERVSTGVRLLAEGVAPVLVVSDPGTRSSFVPSGLCGSDEAIVCVAPVTIDTAGEARALAALVEERGWRKVVVVTSEYHLRRAAMLDRSCTNASIAPMPADDRPPRAPLTGPRASEIPALAFSWMFQRC
jgi:uncharacterized SAM-binding protein YcdF (DUF218 family)